MPFVPELLKYRNKYFVETGTCNFETTQYVKDSGFFDHIYTIEYSDVYYKKAVKHFESTPNVTCFYGSSRTDLEFMIKDIDQPITFWLDAHWSGIPDIGVENNNICPVLEELEQIKKHPIKNHTIIIDDMRLMDGKHFPVTIPQIIHKLMEINPNYKLKGYADSECMNDVLVACVEEPNPFCIQKYLQRLTVPALLPGIGDILRGSIAMIQYAKKYNYKFYLDRTSHPIWKYFEPCEYTIENTINNDVEMFVNGEHLPGGFEQVEEVIEKKFQSNTSFSCITNSFYHKEDGKYSAPNVNSDVALIMKKILKPSGELKAEILNTYKKLGLDASSRYAVIHLRCGDISLENENAVSIDYINYLVPRIQELHTQNPGVHFVLVTDSSGMGRLLKERIPSLFYTDITRIHLGTLSKDHSNIITTLAEMFLIINSKVILSNSRSGFSSIPSAIYHIPYHPIFPYHPVF